MMSHGGAGALFRSPGEETRPRQFGRAAAAGDLTAGALRPAGHWMRVIMPRRAWRTSDRNPE
jgi:hypothetical protein